MEKDKKRTLYPLASSAGECYNMWRQGEDPRVRNPGTKTAKKGMAKMRKPISLRRMETKIILDEETRKLLVLEMNDEVPNEPEKSAAERLDRLADELSFAERAEDGKLIVSGELLDEIMSRLAWYATAYHAELLSNGRKA
ncbi:MAG: hypothetical protein ACI4CE_07480 [Methanomethylophilus alvi]